MTRVSVSELKTHLSRYLREVRRGGEIEILDRGIPVARLTPLPKCDEREGNRRERLIRTGVLRAGQGDASTILDHLPLEIPTSIVEAVDEERGDRF